LLCLTVYTAASYGRECVDWIVAVPKLVHFFFHTGLHVFPEFSDTEKLNTYSKVRAVCGMLMGTAQKMAWLIYTWRMGGPCHLWFVISLLAFPLDQFVGKHKVLYQLLEAAYDYSAVCYAMFSADACSWASYVASVGLILRVAEGMYIITGQCVSPPARWHGKWWLREDDRATVAYHVVSDIGNSLMMVCSTYKHSAALGSIDPILWLNGMGPFPQCGIA